MLKDLKPDTMLYAPVQHLYGFRKTLKPSLQERQPLDSGIQTLVEPLDLFQQSGSLPWAASHTEHPVDAAVDQRGRDLH